MDVNMTTLDPAALSQNPAQSIASHVVEPLYRQATNLEWIPALAVSYERPDANTWRFKLRPGVKFQNGEPFSADDVVYNLNRVKDTSKTWIAPVNAFFMDNVEKAVKVDDLTVDFTTKSPTAFLLSNIARLLIVPKSAEAKDSTWGLNPVGTGPFEFVDLVPGERVTLKRNEGYWGEKPAIATLVFRPLIENSTRVAALQAGDVQVINSVPIDSLSSIRGNAQLKVDSTTGGGSQVIGLVMRVEQGPLKDPLVRQAIAHAIDRDSLARDIFGGLATPATSPFPPGLLGRKEFPPITYDPALSRQLLTQAGYPDGIKLSYGIPLGNYLDDKKAGEAVAGMLQEAGIDVTGYEEMEWGQFFPAAVQDKKFDIYFYGLGSPDPSFLVFFQSLPLYHDWAPPEVADLVKAATAGPEEASVAPLEQLQQLMWDQTPWAFMYYQPTVLAMQANIEGVHARQDTMSDFRDAVVTGP